MPVPFLLFLWTVVTGSLLALLVVLMAAQAAWRRRPRRRERRVRQLPVAHDRRVPASSEACAQ